MKRKGGVMIETTTNTKHPITKNKNKTSQGRRTESDI
jgi:hypothetical protein